MSTNWTLGLFGLAVICIIVNGYQKPLTENVYIMNTYMYILFALIAISSTVVYLDKCAGIDYIVNNGRMHFFGLFILLMTTLFATMMTSPENYIIKHLSWLAFLAIIGIMIYPVAKVAMIKGKLWSILSTLAAILGALSFIAFTKPLGKFLTWGNMLTILLLGLIIFEVVDMLFSHPHDIYFFNRTRIYSWLAILLFSGFMLYDTQKLILHSKIYQEKCRSTTNIEQLECVDYPNESLGIFLDIMNLFTSMTNIS